VNGLLQRIDQNIRNRQLLKRGQAVLVAVSGGLDSMALLHALHSLKKKWRWKITVAHFNHQLRGRASDADEKLVRKTAAAMKLPFVAGRANVKEFALKSKLSIEMAARKLRHEFFTRAAHERKIRAVALAHHADDQVELFFLRVMRGAGGEGLAGMKWNAPSPADKKITLVRPLLDSGKEELRQFVRERIIVFRDDATNLSSDFLRNRIRNELLPLLRKKYQPGLDKAVLRMMEIVGAESDFVGEAALAPRPCVSKIENRAELEKHGRPARAAVFDFEKLPVAIQRRILRLQLAELGVAADFELVESLRKSAGCFVSVGQKTSVARGAGGNVFLRAEQASKFNGNKLAVKLDGAGDVNFGGLKFIWSFWNGWRGRSPRRIRREFFDADKIGGGIILRHWRAGDRFQPIGLKSAAKLQDLFTNAKVPRERRRDLIVAEAASGEIFWVEGLRISENFKITPQTKKRLILRWQNQG
jgi:tRNA(Ile)-lysidine synthase